VDPLGFYQTSVMRRRRLPMGKAHMRAKRLDYFGDMSRHFTSGRTAFRDLGVTADRKRRRIASSRITGRYI
jgi:hypothetical protein